MDKVKAYYKPASGQLQPVKPYLHRPATGGTPAITAPLTAYFAPKKEPPGSYTMTLYASATSYWQGFAISFDNGASWTSLWTYIGNINEKVVNDVSKVRFKVVPNADFSGYFAIVNEVLDVNGYYSGGDPDVVFDELMLTSNTTFTFIFEVHD